MPTSKDALDNKSVYMPYAPSTQCSINGAAIVIYTEPVGITQGICELSNVSSLP